MNEKSRLKILLSLSSMKFLLPIIIFSSGRRSTKEKSGKCLRSFHWSVEGCLELNMQQIQGFHDVLESELYSLILCATPSNTELMLCFCDMPILKSLFAPIKIFRKKNLFFIHRCKIWVFEPHFVEYQELDLISPQNNLQKSLVYYFPDNQPRL